MEGLVDLIEPTKACVCLILNLSVNTQGQLTHDDETQQMRPCAQIHTRSNASRKFGCVCEHFLLQFHTHHTHT